LDPAAYAAERQKSRTDTWVQPPPQRAADAPPRPADKRGAEARGGGTTTVEARKADSGLNATLREAQGQLAGKSARLAQAERARDEAQASLAESEERAAQLRRELEQLRAEHSFQQDEHARAHAHFEEELSQARALVSAASGRHEELRRRLEELENA